MAIYTVLGGTVLSQSEYVARSSDISAHLTAIAAGNRPAQDLALGGGQSLSAAMEVTPRAAAAVGAPTTVGFDPVGENLPLTVLIRHVYTGQFPKRGWFNHRGDMAVVSGVKGFSTFNASARAVNFLETGVAPNSHFIAPAALSQGTPYILYSPAVTDDALTMTIEFAFADTFARELLDSVSDLFSSAAGLPVLLPYSGYLLGASKIVKLAEGVADGLYQSAPPFQRTEVLNFNLPGAPMATADFLILCNPALAADQYAYKDGMGLVDTSGKAYAGDEPYLVVSLDGRQNDRLKGFTPTVASAAVLQQFFQVKDGGTAITDTLKGALSIYSDMQYRQMADKVAADIKAAGANVPATLKSQWTADVANITEATLKPQQPF